jgi:hypothetical protein
MTKLRPVSLAWAATAAILSLVVTVRASATEPSVLDLNDEASRMLLKRMSAEGNLKANKLAAEAWVIVSSVAMGMGLQKCHFFKPDDMSFMWKPAREALSDEEILTLNRVITSNFRNSERGGRLLRERLFPITRQAAISLSAKSGIWSCREISRVWEAARSYVTSRGL